MRGRLPDARRKLQNERSIYESKWKSKWKGCDVVTYYRVCPLCGCNLDPDERCDCIDMAEKEETAPRLRETVSGENTPTTIIVVRGKEIKAVKV